MALLGVSVFLDEPGLCSKVEEGPTQCSRQVASRSVVLGGLGFTDANLELAVCFLSPAVSAAAAPVLLLFIAIDSLVPCNLESY